MKYPAGTKVQYGQLKSNYGVTMSGCHFEGTDEEEIEVLFKDNDKVFVSSAYLKRL